jgi:hypothetical protein
MRNVSQANLLSVKLPLVSLEVQRETADILEDH